MNSSTLHTFINRFCIKILFIMRKLKFNVRNWIWIQFFFQSKINLFHMLYDHHILIEYCYSKILYEKNAWFFSVMQNMLRINSIDEILIKFRIFIELSMQNRCWINVRIEVNFNIQESPWSIEYWEHLPLRCFQWEHPLLATYSITQV